MAKTIIISIDAMGALDIQQHLTLVPTLRMIKENGTHVEKISGIYPTLTYPSHTTIVTGVYPNKHGIVNNTKIQPQRKSPDWFWYQKAIKTPTLYDVAKAEGLTTAAFLWPVTAKSRIDWNIAEIFPNRIWTNQILISLQASSPLFLLEMDKKYGILRDGIKQPQLDDFITACAVDTIENKQPDLTLIHLVDMDSMRHSFGVESPEALAAFKRQDTRVAEIIAATKRAGTFNDTTFIILGDHYQIDVHTMIRINALLAEQGWLKVTRDGTVAKDYTFYAKSCDGSCYIYSQFDAPTEKLKQLLLKMPELEEVISGNEAKNLGADENCALMLEAKRGYYFIDEASGKVTEKTPNNTIGQSERYKAVHGFSPEKMDYYTTMLVMGPQINQNKTIACARLIDEAPTFAKIINLQTFPQNIDGCVISGIVK